MVEKYFSSFFALVVIHFEPVKPDRRLRKDQRIHKFRGTANENTCMYSSLSQTAEQVSQT